VVCLFDSGFAMILVGALFVGSIATVWHGDITPHSPRRLTELPADGAALAKGEEMGRFNMGSTVILLTPPGHADWLTGFAEYDYYGFGTKQNTFGPCGVLVCGAATTLPVDVKENVNVFKAGLNFKFGPTAPVVGRY
jgi:hypothetical protein